jgi:hypothetical protein
VDPLDKKGSVGHQFTTDGKVGACPARLRAAGRRDLPGSWVQGGACLCLQVRIADQAPDGCTLGAGTGGTVQDLADKANAKGKEMQSDAKKP